MIKMKAYFRGSIVLAVLLTAFLPFAAMAATGAQGDETPAAPATSLAYSGDGLRFEHLTSEDGLSTDRMQYILQDSRGFMWFSTQDGLNRYDGNEFREFKHKPGDKNSLSGNFIWVIFEDQDGMLWMGTFGGGLNRYDPTTEGFTRYRHDPEDPHSLGSDIVYAIYQDHNQSLWIGTSGGGLNRYESDIDGFTRFKHNPIDSQSLSHDTVWAITEDAEGVMWIGTDGGGLNRLDPQTESFRAYRHSAGDPNSLGHDSVRAVYQDNEGIFWLGTQGGGLDRLEFDGEGGEAAQFTHYRNDPDDPSSLSNDNVSAVYEDETGGLWIGTVGGGLSRFDRRTEQFSRYQTDPNDPYSLSHNSIRSVFGDPTGLLWVGTTGGGVNILDLEAKAFEHIYSIPGQTNTLSNNDVMGIYEEPEGILWVGTGSGGLNKIDPQTQQVTYYQYDPDEPDSISHNMVREVVQDQQGTLWLATRQGLDRFDPRTGKATAYLHDPGDPSSLLHNNVYSVYQAEDGMIWVGTRAGPNRLDPLTGEISADHRYLELDDSLRDAPVASIDQDATGVLWMGTAGGGLISFDPQAQLFTQYDHNADDPKSLADSFVWNVYVDRTGNLWVGTAAGLDRFDGDTGGFIHFNEKDGLSTAGVMSILQDDLPAEAGGPNLWFSTREGLIRFNPESGAVRRYDVSDGLQGDDFGWSSAFKNQQGDLFFGGTNGLTVFNPSQIVDNPYIPPVVITDFQLAGKSVGISEDSILKQAIQGTEHLVLSYEDRVVSFEFAALNYRAPEKNRYRYLLEGFDEDWTEVGSDRRFVTYTNLGPGEYTFRVLGSNSDGVWNEEGVSLGLIITPPWWQTWWFRALMLLAVIAALIGGYQWRGRSARIRNRELESLVAERTNELTRINDVLRESEEKYRDLVENIDDVIYSLDAEGVITYVSPSAESLLGARVPEIVGRHFAEFIHPEDLAQARENFQSFAGGHAREPYEYRMVTRSGEIRWTRASSQPIWVDERVLGVRGMLTDITERRQAEEALHQRVGELNCLYGISRLAGQQDITLEEILAGAVELVPSSWHYPEIAEARIILGSQEYETGSFAETAWRQVAALRVQGEQAGTVEVCYLEEKPERDEGPFLKEERNLLNAVAERLGHIVERLRAEEALRKTRDELATLLALSRDVTSTLELEPLLSLILDQLRGVVDYEMATIRRLEQGVLERLAYRRFFPHEAEPNQRLVVANIPILRDAVQTQKAALIGDLRKDPDRFRELEAGVYDRPGLILQEARTLMAVPLLFKSQVVGVLVLAHRQPECFDRRTMALAQAFANQVAVALVNADLYEKAGEAATLGERTRLARELHDSATQSLYSATLFSEAGKELAAAGDLESAQHYLGRVSEVVHQALKDMRLLVFELRPPVLEKEGLVGALQRRLDAVEKRAGMEARLISDALPSLPDEVADGLYRIAQEALNNVLKHAEADVVTVTIRAAGETVLLEVADNGRGFDLDEARSSGGMGLVSMRERAVQLGGELTIDSTPGQGTKLKVSVGEVTNSQEPVETSL